ncbi:hypothetical protein [Vannielia sp.]|uniref:hypothetical protein n=1 Tax=Vannielia sp. TaxID=2813045 RepID=UPI00262F9823|nr:hypothetical protein [Vannielia sp.]MDF1873821.1 hypothetical protein [Vannielia sp.]
MRSLALLLLTAAPAFAEGPLTVEQFSEHVTGRTIWFSENGHLAGGEEYLPNKQVRWVNSAGECMTGYYDQLDDMICFHYDQKPNEPQCWTIFIEPEGLRHVFLNDPNMAVQLEIPDVDDPLLCLGPEVGV